MAGGRIRRPTRGRIGHDAAQRFAGSPAHRRADDGRAAERREGPQGGLPSPRGIESVDDERAAEWRDANPSSFPNGGHRWVVPLRKGQTTLGEIVLADRVNGAPYSREALDLLQCIGDQVASALHNLRLGHELAEARELEAFRAMPALFVRDLTNAAGSLNLMSRNRPCTSTARVPGRRVSRYEQHGTPYR